MTMYTPTIVPLESLNSEFNTFIDILGGGGVYVIIHLTSMSLYSP